VKDVVLENDEGTRLYLVLRGSDGGDRRVKLDYGGARSLADLGQAMGGFVRSQTLKAFAPEEVDRIVARMP
jgi:hypothetical protein